MATDDREVLRFRERYLHGPLVPAGRVGPFLDSPLHHRRCLVVALRGGVPFDHLGQATAIEGPSLVNEQPVLHVAMRDSAAGSWGTFRAEVPVRGEQVWMEYATEDDGRRWRMRSGSMLGELHALAVKLGDAYGWHPALAAVFVLEGDTPGVRPIRATITRQTRFAPSHTIGRAVITIEPWVPAEALLKVYRDIQEQLLPKASGGWSARRWTSSATTTRRGGKTGTSRGPSYGDPGTPAVPGRRSGPGSTLSAESDRRRKPSCQMCGSAHLPRWSRTQLGAAVGVKESSGGPRRFLARPSGVRRALGWDIEGSFSSTVASTPSVEDRGPRTVNNLTGN